MPIDSPALAESPAGRSSARSFHRLVLFVGEIRLIADFERSRSIRPAKFGDDRNDRLLYRKRSGWFLGQFTELEFIHVPARSARATISFSNWDAILSPCFAAIGIRSWLDANRLQPFAVLAFDLLEPGFTVVFRSILSRARRSGGSKQVQEVPWRREFPELFVGIDQQQRRLSVGGTRIIFFRILCPGASMMTSTLQCVKPDLRRVDRIF